jgi:hypothetical protein
VLAAGLRNVKSPREIMKEAIEETGRGVALQLERYLTTLGTIAGMAPLLGLFGTVIGMIEIFGAQSASGTPAQLAQGIAHDVSMQKATLLSHQDSMADRRVRLAFEWSHVVYFPNLLFQSCHESLVGAKGKTA